ncbi:hypothetical protein Tco_0853381 [Tanacetum coccineum]
MKKVLEEEAESDAESEGVNEAERKFAQLANDEEVARMVQEEWEAEEEKKKLVEEEATKVALIRDYDDIQARIKADRILAARLQEEEREKFIIEERAKLLHDTIVAQMRSNENFVAIGSPEDESIIRELNKKAASTKKADSIKEESKEEAYTRKRKLGTRKKMKSRKRRFRHGTSEDEKENGELRLYLTIAPNEDKEFDETKGLEEINLNMVIRSNGQRRDFSTLMRVLSIFDREDLNDVYKLVMDRYQNEVPEGFNRVLWGDLMIMFNPNDEDEFWNSQHDWNVVSWKLHGSSGLESEEDSTMALELIRFVKKIITELELEEPNENKEDL